MQRRPTEVRPQTRLPFGRNGWIAAHAGMLRRGSIAPTTMLTVIGRPDAMMLLTVELVRNE